MKFRIPAYICFFLLLDFVTPSSAQENSPSIEIIKNASEKEIKNINITNLYFNTGLEITNGLHDPQEILSEEQSNIIKKLIAEHQDKSKIPITLFLFKQNQKISLTKSKFTNHINKIFPTGNHLLIYYYYGEPLNSTGYLLLEDDQETIVSNWETDEMFLKSSRDASVEIEKIDQLQSYLRELSKRSFWVESKFIPSNLTSNKKTSTEVIDAEQKATGQSNQTFHFISQHFISIIAAIALVIAGVWFYLWSRWRKYVLPLKDMPRRLGADFGATVSTPLEFSDVKVSLSDQRGKANNKSLDNI